jgi:hypothetical protein
MWYLARLVELLKKMRCYLKNGNIKEREKRARNEREIDRAKEERKKDINNSF